MHAQRATKPLRSLQIEFRQLVHVVLVRPKYALPRPKEAQYRVAGTVPDSAARPATRGQEAAQARTRNTWSDYGRQAGSGPSIGTPPSIGCSWTKGTIPQTRKTSSTQARLT
jgi:hypothetical protein